LVTLSQPHVRALFSFRGSISPEIGRFRRLSRLWCPPEIVVVDLVPA